MGNTNQPIRHPYQQCPKKMFFLSRLISTKKYQESIQLSNDLLEVQISEPSGVKLEWPTNVFELTGNEGFVNIHQGNNKICSNLQYVQKGPDHCPVQ